MKIITLTTDFGRDSGYVAQMKGVLLSLCNQPPLIVDVSHAVPPQDVFAGALLLADVCGRFPAGTLHVAVVDPGVGTSRRIVYAELGEQKFIGPDNGLFSFVARGLPLRQLFAVENQDFWQKDYSATFHGRDIMIPVAAAMLNGVDPNLLGPAVDKFAVELPWPGVQSLTNGTLEGEVVHQDSFGNLITNIPASQLGGMRIRIAGQAIDGVSTTYGDSPPGTLIALTDSGGRLEIAVVNGSAAQRLKVGRGEKVLVEPM